MKKLLLSLAMLALLAAPSLAYVQSGHLVDGATGSNNGRHYPLSRWLDPQAGNVTPPTIHPLSVDATQPIPEPGTMVLASLGLLALGASRARRRGR